jgi:hypothetical protein
MASYYPSPSSPFSGARRSTTPDALHRPPSVLMEKMNLYSPDVYAGVPPTGPPLQPYPSQPARVSGWPQPPQAPRPESPAQTGRSAPAWTFPQAPEAPAPIQRTHRTFLQWKAEAQATTADYQRNGFPSPVAWVLLSVSSPSCATYVSRRYILRGMPSPGMPSSGVWTARVHGTLPECFTRSYFGIFCTMTQSDFWLPRAQWVSLMFHPMNRCKNLVPEH